MLIQAEKFKARIEVPKGMPNLSNLNNLPNLQQDMECQSVSSNHRVENRRIFRNVNDFMDMMMPYDYDKLRSKFVKPEGLAPLDSEILFLRNFDQDDEFFHVTSQIEPTLRGKIERGEFIELERLLPKDRFGNKAAGDELNKHLFQLITQGTSNYLEPPISKNGKINSIKKWDQAFRVFMAIYTHANPNRAS